MSKNDPSAVELVKLEAERTHFHYMLAKNPNYFGNIPGSSSKPIYKLIADESYEALTCVGYNPDTENMEATFSIKKSAGYSGNLCAAGSFEYLRFYLDFHDGTGFIDQGSVAIHVHDIPAANDCTGHSIFPIKYAATLKKKTSRFSDCEKPLLPTLRVILSWSIEPPVNSPDWKPVWGSVMNCEVQIRPSLKLHFPLVDWSKYLELAVASPSLTVKQLAEITQIDLSQVGPQPKPHLGELVKISEKISVPASRFAFKSVYNMIKYPTSEITLMDQATLTKANINWSELIDKLGVIFPKDTSKANVDYEELECIGLDYNLESLV
ncbi:MAG TPA: hypothetical protein VIM65_10975, partial [Cyclobacteriaceae bacterium]